MPWQKAHCDLAAQQHQQQAPVVFLCAAGLQAVASTRCGVVDQQDASCTAAAGSELLVAHHTQTNLISNAACVDTLTGHGT